MIIFENWNMDILVTTGLMLGMVLVMTALIVQSLSFRKHREHVLKLQTQLDMFSETSINVARCVDRLLTGEKTERTDPQNSRRWLLEEAQMRIAQGNRLQEIAAPLGLSRDEVRLLLRTSSNAADLAQHSHQAVAASH